MFCFCAYKQHRVETQGKVVAFIRLDEVMKRRVTQLSNFCWCDSVGGCAVHRVTPLLDLNKDKHLTLLHDEVNLAPATGVIGLQDLVPLTFQVVPRYLFRPMSRHIKLAVYHVLWVVSRENWKKGKSASVGTQNETP